MNRYKQYLELKDFNKQVQSLEEAEEYLKNYGNEQRFYLYSKLAGMFEFILKQKQYEENLKSRPIYSDSDIEFLKELNILDLTHNEAFLTKRTNEHYDALRYLSYRLYFSSPKVNKAVDEEAKRLGENCTPRLLVMSARKANKK